MPDAGFSVRVIGARAADKEVAGTFPVEEVAVVLIRREEQLLAVYNENWRAFTLPMTRRRAWRDPQVKKAVAFEEKWEDAAVRLVAKCLGRTITEKPEFLLELGEFLQSMSSGEWKRYRLNIFEFSLDDTTPLAAGLVAEWLSPESFLDKKRGPISPTARHVLNELKLNHKL